MTHHSNSLRAEYTIDTPESVSYEYEIAGIGSRFIGALVDSIAIVFILVVLNIILGLALSMVEGADTSLMGGFTEDVGWLAGLLIAIYLLLNFIVIWGYYIVFEMLLNGQTPGKQIAKTRVVRADGNPAGSTEIVIRNLVRIIDFLPFAYAIGLVTMFLNQQSRRLGDFAGGTIVILEHQHVTLESVRRGDAVPAPQSDAARTEQLMQKYPNIQRLSATDYELIDDALKAERQGTLDDTMLVRLARTIAAKLACEAPPPSAGNHKARQMLSEVVELYRMRGLQ